MDELILDSISVGVQGPDSNDSTFAFLHTGKAWRRRGARSRPDADVIDGVENTTPPARWPLLAQMVCNLTKTGHWKSEGRLQGSRTMWVVSVSGAGQHYNEMLLLSFSRISTFQVNSLERCQFWRHPYFQSIVKVTSKDFSKLTFFETRGHLFVKFGYVFKPLPHLVVTRGIKGGDDFMLCSGSVGSTLCWARICRYTPWSTGFFFSFSQCSEFTDTEV